MKVFPDYHFNEISAEKIHQNIIFNGCCLLRSAIAPEKIIARAREIEEISAAKDQLIHKGTALGPMERFHILEDEFKRHFPAKSLYDLVNGPRWHEIFAAIFGKKRLFSKKTYHQHPVTCTRGIDMRSEAERDLTSFRALDFHIDAPYHPPYSNFSVNVWVPFSDCGVDAPGLQLIPVNYQTIQALVGFDTQTNFQDKERWSKESIWSRIKESMAGLEIWKPEFNLGDVLLMTSWLPHASYATEKMQKPRRSVELRHYGNNVHPEPLKTSILSFKDIDMHFSSHAQYMHNEFVAKENFKRIDDANYLESVLYAKLATQSQITHLSSYVDIKKIALRSFIKNRTYAAVYFDIADFLLKSGSPEIAQHYYKMCLEQDFTPTYYSGYLQCLMLSPNCSPEKMFEEASGYNKFFTGIKRFDSHANPLDPKKKLNVGYICHFFHNNIAQSSLIPFLRAHASDKINVYCYSDTAPGEAPPAVTSVAHVWRDTKGMDDDAFAALVRADGIDVLLELNGHCAINRYGVIARKPAPVQISFYNIATTSGVSGFDYILLGDEATLDKSQPFYSESLYYVKGTAGVIEFADYFPDCAPPPCLQNGFVTFGSFNAAHKVNSAVVKLWSKVLKAIPDAKFYMKAGVLSEASYVNAYQTLFAAEGIAADRIRFEGFSPHAEMVGMYADMDIALDTFPHGAGTTTMEALWQGVPVIALFGEHYCGQHGKMILTSIGHPEMVAYTDEEFVAKAVALAADKEQLIRYRQTLRDDFKASPRADLRAFSAKLEEAYQDMWERYCNVAQPA